MYERHNEIATEAVFTHYKDMGVEPDDDQILDVDVSFDATWQKRGHKSNVAASFVVEADTGMVMDYSVTSKYCNKCIAINHYYKADEDTHDRKMAEHKQSGDCEVNYEGSSGGMEKHMAQTMWGRSVEKNKMRYTNMISDGDSSAFNALQADPPYPGYEIKKVECVNHVSKRLGTHLRKLKDESRVEARTMRQHNVQFENQHRAPVRSTLGGRGKLTDKAITKMQSYYGKAIRDHADKSVGEMAKACMSGLKHVTSNDDRPRHEDCAQGRESWCFYNRAIAEGKEVPSHKDMKLSVKLQAQEYDKVEQIYKNLTDENLLSRCLKGRTQNPNESLHSRL
jgi:hypothetical protein